MPSWQWSVSVVMSLGSLACAAVGTSRNDPQAANAFERYAEAVGGRQAVLSITTRVTVAELIAGPNRAPLEIYQAAPDYFLRVLRSSQVALSEIGFDGPVISL